jgi:DmsE family decaheme c-type cytochrome
LVLLASARVQDKTAPWRRAGKLVGEAACKECHEEQHKAISDGWHAIVLRSARMSACETCHGPGAAHCQHSPGEKDNDPELITHPDKLTWSAQKELCGSCHKDQIEGHGGDVEGFPKSGKLCTGCHTIHVEKTPEPHAGVVLASLAEANGSSAKCGSKRCVECHAGRDQLLQQSYHFRLGSNRHPEGCEKCHGHGEMHAASGGHARLITVPSRAKDANAACLPCHENVDAVEYHWKGKHKPLLSKGLVCASCHRIHEEMPEAEKLDRLRGNARPAPMLEIASFVASVSGAGQPGPTNELCVKCHAPVFAQILQRAPDPVGQRHTAAHTALLGTIHADLAGRALPLDKGCGACHAGGEEHARSGGKKAPIDGLRPGPDQAKHQLRVCGACHSQDQSLVHVRSGSHAKNDVACTACHDVGTRTGTTKRNSQERCADCHKDVAAQFRLPNHHPVPEGRMGCVDCHDPHGARPKIRDLELKHDRCVACHKEYAGPFVFAHQADRSDGCVICHSPHGASNRRMLQQVNTQQNCMQCHGDFPIFHDQKMGSVFTDCIKCHTEVHGSNHSRFLFR